MATLATIAADITVTNLMDLPEDLVIAGIRLEYNVAKVVNMSNREDGDKSNIYDALYIAEQEGHISTVGGPLSVLTDGVPSGHTLTGGQDALGTIATDTL